MKLNSYFAQLKAVFKAFIVVSAMLSIQTSYAAEMENATVFTQPRTIAPFKLQDDSGKTFTNANLTDHWSLLFFGFTNCAMICPTNMTELNKMYQLLEKSKVKELPQVVFISVDPERDTVKRVHDYVRSFNPNFVGVTGDEKQISALSKQMGAMYMKLANKENPKNYDIDHSAFMMLVDPKGQMYGIFSSPHEAKTMAKNFKQITKT
ncbi:MAG: Electron transport protein SCO1/SenC [Gammaproteobacteria bacterium]|jgi:protein SCO1/2|nr:Electron transport protein SCO1/SenC [Gammaproteobacteria bacterium]